VVTDDYEKGEAQLQALSRVAMAKEDADLLEAAKAVATEIRRAPAEAGNGQVAQAPDTPTLKSVEAAQLAISAVDTLLKGTEK
jgi:hypothetical protein